MNKSYQIVWSWDAIIVEWQKELTQGKLYCISKTVGLIKVCKQGTSVNQSDQGCLRFIYFFCFLKYVSIWFTWS